MEKHQKIAILIFVAVIAIVYFRDGSEELLGTSMTLAAALCGVLFYRFFAFLGSFGFMEYFARDYGAKNQSIVFAVLFWLLFLIAGFLSIFH